GAAETGDEPVWGESVSMVAGELVVGETGVGFGGSATVFWGGEFSGTVDSGSGAEVGGSWVLAAGSGAGETSATVGTDSRVWDVSAFAGFSAGESAAMRIQ